MSEEVKPLIDEKMKSGLEILEAAVLLGILGDGLLRVTPLGVNVFLWALALAAAAWALIVRRRGDLKTIENGLLITPIIIFAAFFAWRDSPTLMLLNALAIMTTLVMFTVQGQNIAVRLAGFFQYALGAVSTGINAAFAPFFLVFGDIKWKTMPRVGWTKHLFSVLRGLAIAAPILFVFGALFMAADAVFDGIVRNTFNISPGILLSHAFLFVFFTWTTAGFLRGVLIGSPILEAFGKTVQQQEQREDESTATVENKTSYSIVESVIHQSKDPVKDSEAKQTNEEKAKPPFFSLGLTEIGIVLGLMNLLFLSFVVVQAKYFFGGADVVRQVTEMTYAEYARRGFFELSWVAALVLPILLVVHFLLRKDNPLNEKVFRFLAGGQIILLFVIMSSALKRMFLYQNEYGLTELRVYTTAFMFWLAIVFVIFCVTVLAGRRERFAFAAFLSALVTIAALHFVNPDALIARVNFERMSEGKYFDAPYASGLSADAMLFLVEHLPQMSEENRCHLKNGFSLRKNYESNADWRSWNWSRRGAWERVKPQIENWSYQKCSPQ